MSMTLALAARTRDTIALLLLTLLVVGGCATVYPPAPYQASDAEYEYRIGPGDTLAIVVWRHPELSLTVPVRPDGRISAPLVKNLDASGKDAASLARDIEAALARFIAEPVVSVVVTAFNAPYAAQVRVLGEVVRPRSLAYVKSMSLIDVLIAADGITDTAAGNRATILRTGEGNKQYSVRIDDLVNRGDASANVEMRPGDILIVPRKSN